MSAIKRIIPLEEVKAAEHYQGFAGLATIFNHDIIEDTSGVWRWKKNNLVQYILDDAPWYEGTEYHGINTKVYRGRLCINSLWRDFYKGLFTCEELMKFYMGIGYSLSGFSEIFGGKEASDFKLPGAKERTNADNPDEYIQTIIDYMLEKHKDTVLKI